MVQRLDLLGDFGGGGRIELGERRANIGEGSSGGFGKCFCFLDFERNLDNRSAHTALVFDWDQPEELDELMRALRLLLRGHWRGTELGKHALRIGYVRFEPIDVPGHGCGHEPGERGVDHRARIGAVLGFVRRGDDPPVPLGSGSRLRLADGVAAFFGLHGVRD